MLIDVVSIFPDLFAPVLSVGMTGRAVGKGAVTVHYTDPRTFTEDKHRTVDDTPYGGGSGMVMRVEPLVRSLQAIAAERGHGHRILLTPTGAALSQATVRRLAKLPHLILICGRYEGVDDRISHYVDEEISIGDFILSGGELGALIIIDAVARLCPGVLHNHLSIEEESFEHGLLEYPQYTRPATYEGTAVPEVLLSGDHEKVRVWRRQQSLLRTRERRPDLFARHPQSKEDMALLAKWDASIAASRISMPATAAMPASAAMPAAAIPASSGSTPAVRPESAAVSMSAVAEEATP